MITVRKEKGKGKERQDPDADAQDRIKTELKASFIKEKK